jgi:hypothetical protein
MYIEAHLNLGGSFLYENINQYHIWYMVRINVDIAIKEYCYDELKHIFQICLVLIAPGIMDLLIINWTWSTYLERIHNNYIS